MFIRSKLDETLHPWLYHRAPDDDTGAGADADTETGGDDDSDQGDGEEAKSSRTYSHEAMERIRLRETKKARGAGRRELLEELGVNDPAEAKKILEAARKAAEKDRTELDKARDRAQTAEQERLQAIRDAAAARLDRDIDRALATAGVQPKRLDRIAKLVVAELGDEPDADDIRQAIETIRDDFPESFSGDAGQGGGDGRRAPSSEGKGGKPARGTRGGNTEDPISRGAERARQMQGRTVNA